MSDSPSSNPDELELLKQQVAQLQSQVSAMSGSRSARTPVWLLLLVALIGGLAGAIGNRSLQNRNAQAAQPGRIQSGRVPFALFQENYTRGEVEFPVPFSKRPLVFVCEGGKPGAWVTVKTDLISESSFVWAATTGPRSMDYQSEIEWIAIEP